MTISILIILILTSISTSILGVYLVLKKTAMMIDSISHTVLLGIVLAYMLVKDLNSPFLIIGATLMGLFTTYLTEALIKSSKTKEDAAIGLVFPLLFSVAIILISTKFSGIHLDIDAVLLGKLELSIFDELVINQVNLGPRLLYVMGVVTLINVLFFIRNYKSIKLITFDELFAKTIGIPVVLIHYLLMTLVSLTAVSAFDAVGSILVVALMVGPAATARLISKEFKPMVLVAMGVSIFNAVLGFMVAYLLDINVSGVVATITLVSFLLVLLFQKESGAISRSYKEYQKKKRFLMLSLMLHLDNHQDNPSRTKLTKLPIELNWSDKCFLSVLNEGIKKGYFINQQGHLFFLDDGYQKYKQFLIDLD